MDPGYLHQFPCGEICTPVENNDLLAIVCKQFHFLVQLHSDGMGSCHPVNKKKTGKDYGTCLNKNLNKQSSKQSQAGQKQDVITTTN